MKIVVFDFDGTLTCSTQNVWQFVWQDLHYSLGKNSIYKKQLNSFLQNKISYNAWCKQTCNAFVKRNMNIKSLNKYVNKTKLINGATETFKSLYKNNVQMHIVSGNILYVIENVLKQNVKYFKSINANNFIFKNNKLVNIVGTNYDFVGKSEFVKNLIKQNNVSPSDIIFVGNGDNDEWVHLSGCKTICINPNGADFNNLEKWNKTISNVKNLTEILPEIL